MSGIYFDANVSDDQRRECLYRGDLFIQSPTPGTRALCEFARELSAAAFAPYHPTEAQDHMPVEQYVSILTELKPKFIHHPQSKKHIQDILREFGCDVEKTYFDVPRLRTMTHSGYLTSGMGLAFHPHRDTWYGAPYCQQVWWLPVYEIERDNGMAFHPHYWERPVKNSSGSFDYQHWERHERKAAPSQVTEDTREISKPLEPMQLDPELRFVTEPAGVTIFSGAQMHSTVANTTRRTRLSIDFRVVNLDDVIAERGAPNIDDASQGSSLGDYLRASDLEPAPADLVSRHLACK